MNALRLLALLAVTSSLAACISIMGSPVGLFGPIFAGASVAPNTLPFSDNAVVFIRKQEQSGTGELVLYSLLYDSYVTLNVALSEDGDVASFFMAPGGRHLAYIADQSGDGVYGLYVVDMLGLGQIVDVYSGLLEVDELGYSFPAEDESSVQLQQKWAATARKISGSVLPSEKVHWAPDGSALACVFEQGTELKIASVDGLQRVTVKIDEYNNIDLVTGERRVFAVAPPHPSKPWSSDSAYIAYAVADMAADGGGRRVYVYHFRGDVDARPVAIHGDYHAWSPDSSRIATMTPAALWMYSPDGEYLALLDPLDSIWTGSLLWAPDSSAFLYQGSYGVGKEAIYYVSSEAGNLAPELIAVDPISHPSWAPDSTRIAYISGGRSGNNCLYTVRPGVANSAHPVSRKNPRCKLSAGEPWLGSNAAPAWSADSATIAYLHPADAGLYVGDADGYGASRVSQSQYRDGSTVLLGISPGQLQRDSWSFDVWSPDAKRMFYLNGHNADQVYARDGGGRDDEYYKLYSVYADGSQRALIDTVAVGKVSALGDINAYARWSPDGSLIMHLKQDRDRYSLRIHPLYGGSVTIDEFVDPNYFEWLPLDWAHQGADEMD